MSSKFDDGLLLHGTTLVASRLIEVAGLMPARGDFIIQMYGECEENADGLPGVFFSNPNDPDGIWGAANAMKQAVSKLMGKGWHDVTLDDIAAHGAMVVVEPDKYSTFKLNDDGSSTSLAGYLTYNDPPAGTEPTNYYSFDTERADSVIVGEELVAMVRLVRRYGDEGSFMFKEAPQESAALAEDSKDLTTPRCRA